MRKFSCYDEVRNLKTNELGVVLDFKHKLENNDLYYLFKALGKFQPMWVMDLDLESCNDSSN